MQAYQEITLLPSEEIPCNFLWGKLYQQLHLALVENQQVTTADKEANSKDRSDYGVSFPNFDLNQNALGHKLRVFAPSREKLEQLDLQRWLSRLIDYCRVSKIEGVPPETEHVHFVRRQFKSNIERLARRRMKRKGESYQDAMDYFGRLEKSKTRLPFIYLDSLSGGQRFPLFIEMIRTGAFSKGSFNTYGLSKTATVPWF